MLITLLASFALPSLAAEKLIALTFDDGPRPYVLYGVKQPGAASSANPGLLDVLDRNGVKATFFYMGWRLTPKTWGETPHETNIGVTCLEAAHDVLRRGHEIENHTYSHANLRVAERKKGEAWVLNDVERGAGVVEAVTGSKPLYLRPPDWDLTDDARGDLEKHGFHILTISGENPVALRDINSQDYLCAGKGVGCPRPSLAQSVLTDHRAAREKRRYDGYSGVSRVDHHHRATARTDRGAQGQRLPFCDRDRVHEARPVV